MPLAKVGSEFLFRAEAPYSFVNNVTVLTNGKLLVTWYRWEAAPKNNDRDAWAQYYNYDGTPAGAAFRVNTNVPGSQSGGTSAQLSSGNYITTWTDVQPGPGSTFTTRATMFNSSGVAINSDFALFPRESGILGIVDMAPLAGGGFVVVANGYNLVPGVTYALYRIFDASGNPVGGFQQAPDINSARHVAPRVTTLSNGQFVIAWMDAAHLDADKDGYGIKARVFNADGSPAISDFLVNATFADDQYLSDVVSLNNGQFAVSYSANNLATASTSDLVLYVRFFNANGVAVSPEVTVGLTSTEGRVVGLPDGRLLVVYSDITAGNGNEDIAAIVYNSDGTVSVPAFIVNTSTVGSQRIDSASLLPNGNVLITWIDGNVTRAQLFDVDGTGEVNGTAGNDSYAGTANADVYNGLAGDDWIVGLGGNDTLNGGDGSDGLLGGTGADALNGGNGYDFARYDSAGAAVAVVLFDAALNTGEAAGDTFTSIEGLVGSVYNDFLYGDANANYIYGLAGDDWIDGYGGVDYLYGGDGADSLLSRAGAQVLDGGAGYDFARYEYAASAVSVVLYNAALNTGEAAGDTFVSIEGLVGSAYNDFLYGDANANYIYGLAGDDWIVGLGGNDTLDGGDGSDGLQGGTGADALNGGNGYDFARYDNAAAAVAVVLHSAALNTGEAAGDTFTSIEGLVGSAYNDFLYGDANANNIFGLAGNDWIDGYGGVDYLYGGDGNDGLLSRTGAQVLDGGNGFDVVNYSASAAGVVAALYNPTINTGDAAGDTYVSIEGLTGSNHADQLYGDAGSNYLYGLDGHDYLHGMGGADYIYAGAGNDTIVFTAGLLAAHVDGGAGTDTLAVYDGALPTGFDLAAAGIEQAQWRQTDTGGASWSTIVSNYNANWNITDSVTVFDDGSRSATYADPGNATSAYRSARQDYDASNRLTYANLVRDDGSQSSTRYDPANTLAYKSLTSEYDAAGRVTSYDTIYDDGTRTIQQFDAANVRADYKWISKNYDTLNRITTINTVYDDNSRSIVYYDAANSEPSYRSLQQNFNTANQLTYAYVTYDNGAGVSTTYDVANQYSWNAVNYMYDAGGNYTGLFYT
jgi:Ca2+-binding RTX toxin-like protein